MCMSSILARLSPLVAAATLCAAPLAQAEVFVFKDWAVSCDNTRGCEAAGFRAEGGNSKPVMLWIAREAGAATPLRARLKVETPGGRAPARSGS